MSRMWKFPGTNSGHRLAGSRTAVPCGRRCSNRAASLTNWWSWLAALGPPDQRLAPASTVHGGPERERSAWFTFRQSNQRSRLGGGLRRDSGFVQFPAGQPDTRCVRRIHGTEETPHIIQPSIPPDFPQHPQLDWILHGTHGLPTFWVNGQSNVMNASPAAGSRAGSKISATFFNADATSFRRTSTLP